MIDRLTIHASFRSLFAVGVLALSPLALHAEDDDIQIAKASDEAALAIQGFKPAAGLKVDLAAAEPNLANPVAFCFDEQGRMYVAETFRQDHGVEDNRGHMNWLEDDLSLQTVDQRADMFRKYLGDKVNDWKKYPERIRRLEDKDHDGLYESATVFATGFNNILDGTGAGVLAHHGNLFFTCIPDLWKLNDTNGDGVADVRESMFHGFGVRVAFRGHDMHGLVMGPDGRVYFSIGDRGYNVTGKEGQHYVRPDTGAVFRCDPDGSGLEVYAYGLRNPQELAFNDEGDLFTGDNNSDGGDRARWVYVAPQGDTGWRMYYQYVSDRGPWNRERMWHPYRDDEQTAAVQPAFVVPCLKNLADGPSGLTFDPGVGLPEAQKGRFFLVDFRGSPGASGVRSFRLNHKGAGFEVKDEEWLMQSILATDVDFGPDGSIYVLDWVDGWTGLGKGRVYRGRFGDQPENSPPSKNLLAEGFVQRPESELTGLLGHADRRIRMEAQYELAQRAIRAAEEKDDAPALGLFQLAVANADSLKGRHALWGWGQVIRKTGRRIGSFEELVKQSNPEFRRQALRVAAEASKELFDGSAGWNVDAIAAATRDAEPRVQFQACLALGVHGREADMAPLLDVLARNQDTDAYLRHAAVVGLTGSAGEEALMTNAGNASRSTRLGVLLALRRMKSPQLASFLSDGDNDVVNEAARAIHDLWIEKAAPSLAAEVRRPGLAELAKQPAGREFVRRIVNTNYRIGGPGAAQAIASIAADPAYPEDVRLEAVQDLMDWSSPPRLDRLTGEFRPIGERQNDEAVPAVRKVIPGLLTGTSALRENAVKLAAKYEIADVGPLLLDLARRDETDATVRVEALGALASMKNPALAEVTEQLLKASQPAVRSQARKVLASLDADRAVKELARVLDEAETTIPEKQSAIVVLSGMENPSAMEVLKSKLAAWSMGTAPVAAIQLDLLDAAEKAKSSDLGQLAKSILEKRPADNPVAQFADCLEGGDAIRGRAVFFGSAAASCRRCHKINGEGSDVGPDLSEIGKTKPRDYLLEAIVNPNAKIAEGFETAVFAMDDGQIYSGVVKKEDDQAFSIVTPKGELLTIEKAHVEGRAKGQSGMPSDISKQVPRREVRDLVEYLTTLVKKSDAGGHH